MSARSARPSRPIPPEIDALVASVTSYLRPIELWLFGSRARGDHRPDSDWDLLAVLPDDASEELMSPLVNWNIARVHPGPVTLLSARHSELDAIWGHPSTLGYDLAREGIRLRVG